ncbi:unnamed protein product [Clavelina lepadiformis]|uniref:Uncharacterized protein n=1 Tax=Clavelina lepadiformis TaxID=159417 RepID=A0ABP0G497_CLALP
MDEDTWVSTQQLKEFQDDSTSHAGERMSTDLQHRIRIVHEVVKTGLDQRRQSMKALYDKSVSRQTKFQVGDKVMLRTTVISKDEKRKFHLSYSGPYEVVEALPPVNYLIRNHERTLSVDFNRQKLTRRDYHKGMPSHSQAIVAQKMSSGNWKCP